MTHKQGLASRGLSLPPMFFARQTSQHGSLPSSPLSANTVKRQSASSPMIGHMYVLVRFNSWIGGQGALHDTVVLPVPRDNEMSVDIFFEAVKIVSCDVAGHGESAEQDTKAKMQYQDQLRKHDVYFHWPMAGSSPGRSRLDRMSNRSLQLALEAIESGSCQGYVWVNLEMG